MKKEKTFKSTNVIKLKQTTAYTFYVMKLTADSCRKWFPIKLCGTYAPALANLSG